MSKPDRGDYSVWLGSLAASMVAWWLLAYPEAIALPILSAVVAWGSLYLGKAWYNERPQ